MLIIRDATKRKRELKVGNLLKSKINGSIVIITKAHPATVNAVVILPSDDPFNYTGRYLYKLDINNWDDIENAIITIDGDY